MKIRLIIIGLIAAVAAAGNVYAQDADPSRVKILPTEDPDVIKLHYAIETNEPLEVKFYHGDDIAGRDRIKGGPYEKGISKRYNVRRINHKDFWIEVASPSMTVTYHVVPSKDGKKFTPFLEKVTYNQALVRK